jgi:RNA polymerase sigma-70 factor (ECF subfamily)
LRRELEAISGLGAILEGLVDAGHAAYPDCPVGDALWADFLAGHLQVGDAARQLTGLHAKDVHLVLACQSADPSAHAELDRRLRLVEKQALSGIRLGSHSADEVVQAVRVKLLVGDTAEGARSAPLGRLSTYSGRGPLDGWLRVTLARAALSLVRTTDTRSSSIDEAEAIADLADKDDPQARALVSRCGPALKSAVEETVASLSPADRALLRLHVIDGLTIDDLAVVYKAHRSTTARRIARVRNAIFEGARARAMSILGLGETEFASLMGVMLSQIDVTLRGAFGKPKGRKGA